MHKFISQFELKEALRVWTVTVVKMLNVKQGKILNLNCCQLDYDNDHVEAISVFIGFGNSTYWGISQSNVAVFYIVHETYFIEVYEYIFIHGQAIMIFLK